MKILIYSETPEAIALRNELRGQRHTAMLYNPAYFKPSDLNDADVVYFPRGHEHEDAARAAANTVFPKGHPREGQLIDFKYVPVAGEPEPEEDDAPAVRRTHRKKE